MSYCCLMSKGLRSKRFEGFEGFEGLEGLEGLEGFESTLSLDLLPLVLILRP